MVDLNALTAANASRWANAKLTREPEFTRPAKVAVANKSRYLAIARQAGMPDIAWVFIAVSHYRESSQDFSKSLAQGDPWNRVSTHVPAGRGPFQSFEDAAVDALVKCSPYAARLKDWSIGGILTNLERYNGLGYASRGVPSAYVWSGTDQYRSGKFVADGVYDPNKVDAQLGVAGLILTMMELDQSITFAGPAPQVQPKPSSVTPSAQPVKDGIWLQNSLNRLGASPKLELDGIVGPATRNAVRAFQLASGIGVDGLVGPETFTALDKALAAGKPVPTMPVPPDIVLPPPGTQAHANLAPTFWGRVLDLFKPKG
ncbi:peptidoglycan-binding protein [Bradyrhizobium ottawaense]|uniref:peptidoglycan-binding protein n=1 Tax=Bradyrhizobium ottawaense TaxID=931866 RepID=UPI001AECA46A|nr:peptidoglycan-binding protein [Bradyrhizobium ottawaense]